jgi:hypothetical protein
LGALHFYVFPSSVFLTPEVIADFLSIRLKLPAIPVVHSVAAQIRQQLFPLSDLIQLNQTIHPCSASKQVVQQKVLLLASMYPSKVHQALGSGLTIILLSKNLEARPRC